MIVLGAELWIHGVVVDHVVAVHAAGPSFQIRREVGVAHAEPLEIGHELRGRAEAEARIELHAIGGARDRARAQRASVHCTYHAGSGAVASGTSSVDASRSPGGTSRSPRGGASSRSSRFASRCSVEP